MISRLRRKPPTTAQNTWATTSSCRSHWRRFKALGLGATLAALILPPVTPGSVAHAGEGDVQSASFVADPLDSGVEQVSYTVSESGHRYKWMPYQPKHPAKKVEPLRAEPAQFTEPVPSQTALHPLDDPFGDRQQVASKPTLPDVQQLLADDTDKKVPLDSLLTPPATAGDAAKKQSYGPLPPVEFGETGDLPSTEEYLAGEPRQRTTTCKSPDDPLIIAPIEKLNHLTAVRAELENPSNRPSACDLAGGDFMPRQWAPTTFMWQASGLCHKPAYFEDVHLERYGHSWGPYVQPLMSGAHFFLNVPILPYKMGLYPPNECIYTLGYYRPGSCAPFMLDPLPLSVRAGLAQAGAAVGMAYLIP